ncbi:MAG: histone deacetylase family protein [Proteobacteria bacterium]|nr:histone deacetylase family protein [Pseudomonadota bacterium]
MTTALYTHPDCNQHRWSKHPERPERLIAVMERISSSGLLHDMEEVSATEISDAQLELAHPPSFIRQIVSSEPAQGLTKVEADTYMSPGSLRATRLAAGANAGATESVLNGINERAFCAIRPPGHHAEIAQAMGFCLFNNVAIAAETALQHKDVDRVAILDFDVHHCNGTVDIFKDREEVLVCSSFQENFYPFRYLDFSNEHIISTPLAPGSTGKKFRKEVERSWIPALLSHKPDFIFISAGFDAHKDDPLGQLMLLQEDYTWVTRLIVDIANDLCGGRIVSTLEGGYDLTALANCVEAHVQVLIDG